jgi:hypothetical protein
MTAAAVIYADSLSRLVAFYGVLGFRVDESETGDYAVLIGPQMELSVIQALKHAASQDTVSDPPRIREETPLKLVIFVPSIDEALAATSVLGGRTKEGSNRWTFRGHTVQDAVDPEGNVYQLRQALRVSR